MTTWRIKLLPAAEQELAELPADIQARFLHLAELLETFGPDCVELPHMHEIEERLWEIRITRRDGIAPKAYVMASGGLLTVLHIR